jgi:hypothetical protein
MKGEANFLGGVASVKGVEGFNTEAAKKRFFEIYLDKVKGLYFTCCHFLFLLLYIAYNA